MSCMCCVCVMIFPRPPPCVLLLSRYCHGGNLDNVPHLDSFAHLAPDSRAHLGARCFKPRLGVHSSPDCLSFMPDFAVLIFGLVFQLRPRLLSTCPVCVPLVGFLVAELRSRINWTLPACGFSPQIICSVENWVFGSSVPDHC